MRVASLSSRRHLHNAAAHWRRQGGGILPLQEALLSTPCTKRWTASSASTEGNYQQMYEQQRYFDADSKDGVTFRAPTAKDAKAM